jgi:broad specificity phosphatase PhoE
MRLWWVRHGPTHSRRMTGWTDLPADLSDHAALARLDAHLPRDAALVSSDLRRAVATADALAAGRRRLPHEPGLREIHFGAWEGRGFAEVEAETPDLIRAFWDSPGTVAPPGGESWNRLAARVQGATDRLVAAAAAGDLVIVAHFGAILAALQRAAGLSAAAVLAQRIEPLSVTRIDRHPDGWQVGAINHLP